jgi:nitroreductase
MEYSQLITQRYSVRKFKDTSVTDEQINAILKAAQAAPTAVDLQPFHIWILKSEEARNKAAETTRFTFGAPVIFVLGANYEEAYKRKKYDDYNYATVDASIVGTHMMLEIENLGLGTTWVGAFDAPKMKELFPEMKDYELIAMFPTGTRSDDSAPAPAHHKRKDIEAFTTVIE